MQLLLGFTHLMSGALSAARRTTLATAPQGAAMPLELDDDLLLSDDLPPDARAVLEAADAAVAEVRRTAERATAAIKAEADREIDVIRKRADAETAAVQAAAAKELSPLLRGVFAELKAMQAGYLKDGKLDEALAVRNRLRAMRSDLFGVKPDPGNLTDYGPSDYGRTLLFEVVGSGDGNVWGTDQYTADSRLAVAAVHAGAVRVGERALVRVTLYDGTERVFDGTERYGIRSLDYGNYSLAFGVERV
jgi:hypothetical protein